MPIPILFAPLFMPASGCTSPPGVARAMVLLPLTPSTLMLLRAARDCATALKTAQPDPEAELSDPHARLELTTDLYGVDCVKLRSLRRDIPTIGLGIVDESSISERQAIRSGYSEYLTECADTKGSPHSAIFVFEDASAWEEESQRAFTEENEAAFAVCIDPWGIWIELSHSGHVREPGNGSHSHPTQCVHTANWTTWNCIDAALVRGVTVGELREALARAEEGVLAAAEAWEAWDARATDWKSVSETAKVPPSDETRHLTQAILSWQDAWRDVAMDQPELPLVRRQLARIDPDRKVLAAALEWHNTRTRTEIEGDNAELNQHAAQTLRDSVVLRSALRDEEET